MKKRIIAVLLIFTVVFLSGCSFFSSKMVSKDLKDAVRTAATDGYVEGEIKGMLSTGTFQSFCCYKVGNTVVASARYYDLPEEATNGVMCFQLPEGFRPRIQTYCNGYIYVNGVSVPVLLEISPSGVVSVSYSKSKTMTQIGFSATFPA